MKSEIKKDPADFVNSHSYVESLVIHYRDKTSFFPDIGTYKKGYEKGVFHKELIEEIKSCDFSDSYFFALDENGNIFYIILKDELIFIFECSRGTSVAQIKMEANDFVDGFQVQGKYRRFFSSIFDW